MERSQSSRSSREVVVAASAGGRRRRPFLRAQISTCAVGSFQPAAAREGARRPRSPRGDPAATGVLEEPETGAVVSLFRTSPPANRLQPSRKAGEAPHRPHPALPRFQPSQRHKRAISTTSERLNPSQRTLV